MAKTRLGSRGSFSGNVVEQITTATTLTPSDSGKVFAVTAASLYTITLPAVAPGINYKFFIQEDGLTGDVTITAASTLIYGNLDIQADTNEDNRVACVGGTSIVFEAAGKRGDSLSLVSDGTYWYATGFSQAQGGFTVS